MSNCLDTGGGGSATTVAGAATADKPAAPTIAPDTIARLRKLDCPTVFNAVHQLTPKENATGDQWRDANMLDPTYMYTDATINAVSPIVADGDTAAVGFATCIEVTTNDPDSHEAMGWGEYYTLLKAKDVPIIAVLKDVDQMFIVSHHRTIREVLTQRIEFRLSAHLVAAENVSFV